VWTLLVPTLFLFHLLVYIPFFSKEKQSNEEKKKEKKNQQHTITTQLIYSYDYALYWISGSFFTTSGYIFC